MRATSETAAEHRARRGYDTARDIASAFLASNADAMHIYTSLWPLSQRCRGEAHALAEACRALAVACEQASAAWTSYYQPRTALAREWGGHAQKLRQLADALTATP